MGSGPKRSGATHWGCRVDRASLSWSLAVPCGIPTARRSCCPSGRCNDSHDQSLRPQRGDLQVLPGENSKEPLGTKDLRPVKGAESCTGSLSVPVLSAWRRPMFRQPVFSVRPAHHRRFSNNGNRHFLLFPVSLRTANFAPESATFRHAPTAHRLAANPT
jgi:hypothetical protein